MTDETTKPRVLAVDVGGSHVKVLLSTGGERRRFASGPDLTAAQMVEQVLDATKDWEYDVVSVGVPAPVVAGRVAHDPVNLGSGWAGFDFERAFGKPTRVVNDAAMQALGSYEGGRMLFLGLGTGLGSAMIVDGVLEPMELGHLPYKKATYEDFVGQRGLDRLGKKGWRKEVADVDRGLPGGARARVHRAGRRQRRAAQGAAAGHAPRRQPERVPRRLPALERRLESASASSSGRRRRR